MNAPIQGMAMNDLRLIGQIGAIGDLAGRNDKETALAVLAASEEGRAVINWCYNPFITFGITWKKEPMYRDAADTLSYSQLPLVNNLLARLASRELTGNAAKEAVEAAFKDLNPAAGKILWLCLNKDLKVGIAEASINSVAPGLIPVFAVMRAHLYEEKLVTKFPVAGEPKLDGNRVTFIARDGSGGYFTRTGKVIASLDHMVPAMLQTLKSWYAGSNGFGMALRGVNHIPNIVLDGEMMSDKGFNEVNGALNRKTDAHGLAFHIFDCLTWEEFDAMGAVEIPYVERRKRVNSIVVHASGIGMAGVIKQTPIEILNSHEEIQEAYQRWRAAGQEGLMVKSLNGFYEKKKARSWLKVKAEDTEDLPVIGVFQGQADGKYAGTIGGVIVQRMHEGQPVEVRVSGLDDATREEIWQLWLGTCASLGLDPDVGYKGQTISLTDTPGPLLGRIVEVEFHEITPDGSLRHPRFVRWRDDKTGEVEK